MKKRNSSLFIVAVLAMLCSCKAPKDFILNGQPVHPLAIKPFFPSPVDGRMASAVTLTSDGFSQAIITDNVSTVANKGIWYRSYISPSEYVDYLVIGKTKCGDFVLLARYSTNTYQETRVEIIRYLNLKLRLKRSFDPGNIRDFPVVIHGNKVVIDSGVNTSKK